MANIYYLIIFLIFTNLSSPDRFDPVNPDASPEARQLLNYLYEVEGNGIISGMHNELYSNEWTQKIIDLTGVEPALWGSDFRYGEWVQYRQQMVNEAINQWNKGKIITLMYHATRPMDPIDGIWKNDTSDEGVQGEMSEEEWVQLMTPGSEIHNQWLNHVDKVAGYLKQLRDANVPILWRPYHEMNGGWFWWGKKKGENGYQKLWKMMYDRYTNYHKLNNLLWVWNANAPNYADPYEWYYPGNEYVDVLATDIYNKDYQPEFHDKLVALGKGKPVAIGETGPIVDTETLKTTYPKFVWFMGWRDHFMEQQPEQHIIDLFKHPYVINHNDIDNF